MKKPESKPRVTTRQLLDRIEQLEQRIDSLEARPPVYYWYWTQPSVSPTTYPHTTWQTNANVLPPNGTF